MQVSERLERRLGAQHNQERAREERLALMECPPVSARLIAHLEIMFSDPGKSANATNPMLGQLLTIQFGCAKVLNYLKAQHDRQSEVARGGMEV